MLVDLRADSRVVLLEVSERDEFKALANPEDLVELHTKPLARVRGLEKTCDGFEPQ